MKNPYMSIGCDNIKAESTVQNNVLNDIFSEERKHHINENYAENKNIKSITAVATIQNNQTGVQSINQITATKSKHESITLLASSAISQYSNGENGSIICPLNPTGISVSSDNENELKVIKRPAEAMVKEPTKKPFVELVNRTTTETKPVTKNDQNQILFHSSTFCENTSDVTPDVRITSPIDEPGGEPQIMNTNHEEAYSTSVVTSERFRFTSELPRLVANASSTFGSNCTKGCSWFPSGDRLLVPCEDAR